MAVPIVDLLEMIEVKKDQGEPFAQRLALPLEDVVAVASIVDVQELVIVGMMGETGRQVRHHHQGQHNRHQVQEQDLSFRPSYEEGNREQDEKGRNRPGVRIPPPDGQDVRQDGDSRVQTENDRHRLFQHPGNMLFHGRRQEIRAGDHEDQLEKDERGEAETGQELREIRRNQRKEQENRAVEQVEQQVDAFVLFDPDGSPRSASGTR